MVVRLTASSDKICCTSRKSVSKICTAPHMAEEAVPSEKGGFKMKNKTNTVSKLRPSESNRCKAHAAHPSLSVLRECKKTCKAHLHESRQRNPSSCAVSNEWELGSFESSDQESNLGLEAPSALRKKIAVQVDFTACIFAYASALTTWLSLDVASFNADAIAPFRFLFIASKETVTK